ncbi:MAG: ribosomal protein S18-alanine N-acetyltransferase [Ruminococcus sp.]|nr:ribosomal protein S18-alanine N-acetyltransferase [Candidatus Copronaster equi]
MLITFVCSGNTCRSPMAQGICEKILSDRNIKDIECTSCGISVLPGDTACENAITAASKYGADISSHLSQSLSSKILRQSDLMVCMTQSHKSFVKVYTPILAPNLKILVPENGISDPFEEDQDVYDKCAKELKEYIEKLIDALTMQIVPMNENHISQIAQIEKQCFSAPWSENALREELSNPNAHFLAGVCGEKVLGYIGVHEVCSEAYIANIAVREDYRRLTIGENLPRKAQKDAFSRHCNFVSLEVRKSNTVAVALYEKQGYNIEGERKDFYTNPVEDALIMTLKECGNNENIVD